MPPSRVEALYEGEGIKTLLTQVTLEGVRGRPPLLLATHVRAHVTLLVILAVAALAPAALAQDPVPTDPVVTEPAPPQPAPDPSPAPSPPPAAKPKPKPRPATRPVQREPAPRVSVPSRPSQPRTTVVTRAPAPTVRQQSRRPERERPVRRKAVTKPASKTPAKSAKKKETATATRRTRELPAAGGVAGTVASAAPASPEAASLPSELVSSTPESDGGIAVTSIVFSVAMLLALALLTLAALPNRQLAVLPGARWIAMRRLDLVIGGTAAIIGVLAALVISQVIGP